MLRYPHHYDENIAREVNNGCGPSGWKGKFIPDTIYGLDISEACKIHDFEYHVGTHRSHKVFADERFLTNMLAIIRTAKWTKFLNPLRRRRARKYYWAVVKFGDKHFYENIT